MMTEASTNEECVSVTRYDCGTEVPGNSAAVEMISVQLQPDDRTCY